MVCGLSGSNNFMALVSTLYTQCGYSIYDAKLSVATFKAQLPAIRAG